MKALESLKRQVPSLNDRTKDPASRKRIRDAVARLIEARVASIEEESGASDLAGAVSSLLREGRVLWTGTPRCLALDARLQYRALHKYYHAHLERPGSLRGSRQRRAAAATRGWKLPPKKWAKLKNHAHNVLGENVLWFRGVVALGEVPDDFARAKRTVEHIRQGVSILRELPHVQQRIVESQNATQNLFDEIFFEMLLKNSVERTRAERLTA